MGFEKSSINFEARKSSLSWRFSLWPLKDMAKVGNRSLKQQRLHTMVISLTNEVGCFRMLGLHRSFVTHGDGYTRKSIVLSLHFRRRRNLRSIIGNTHIGVVECFSTSPIVLAMSAWKRTPTQSRSDINIGLRHTWLLVELELGKAGA
ncbi:hypothetical protein Tco_0344725 [Tanacetum coccineum]|uniref:Uncharacterized protein n=1 Tax=Tanacetum coccineum TaxID=301880 RepID=A0ABQ5I2R9_9ASTR